MSITTSNEVNRLFSQALGDSWMKTGLMARPMNELAGVSNLADDTVSQVLNHIEGIGRTLGAGDPEDVEASDLGWAIATLAEYANVCLFMASMAREMSNPKYRKLHESTMLQD